MSASKRSGGRVSVGVPGRAYSLIPTLACLYPSLIAPLLQLAVPRPDDVSRVENKLYWTSLAAVCIGLTLRYKRDFRDFSFHSSLIWLLSYLLLAGSSVIW